jgi:beta-glucosidase
VCIGEHPSVEKPGDIDELTLAADQQATISEAVATGKPVILVLFAGRPRMLSSIPEQVSAVIWAGQPGPFAGKALSAILSGDISPSGRLPFTFPHSGSVFFTHDHKWADRVGADYGIAQEYSMDGVRPAWAFGHGLSYSTFTYSRPDVVVSFEGVSVSFSVTNTGRRAARENILVFIRDHFASITPEVRRLAGFETRWLHAGESAAIDLKLPFEAFSFINMANERVVEPGAFSILVGEHEVEFVLTEISLASSR